jgi:hypothetical protein
MKGTPMASEFEFVSSSLSVRNSNCVSINTVWYQGCFCTRINVARLSLTTERVSQGVTVYPDNCV